MHLKHTIAAYTTAEAIKIKNSNINLNKCIFHWFLSCNYITIHSAINIRMTASAKQNQGLYELKQHKPWFQEECLPIYSMEAG